MGALSQGLVSFLCSWITTALPEKGFRGIITNKHIVQGASRTKFSLNVMDGEGSPIPKKFMHIEVEDFKNMWIPHPDTNIDLCFIDLKPINKLGKEEGVRFFNLSLDKTLIPTEQELEKFSAIEKIIMVGYPVGIWDNVNNKPIVRQGVTATPLNNDYKGEPKFLIDAAVWKGSSGSPVFIFDEGGYRARGGGVVLSGSRVKFLGIVSHLEYSEIEGKILVGGSTESKHLSSSKIPVNLGIVIKARKVLDFESIFKPAHSRGVEYFTPPPLDDEGL